MSRSTTSDGTASPYQVDDAGRASHYGGDGLVWIAVDVSPSWSASEISSEAILEIPFLNAGKGQGSFYVDRLPVLTARTDSLPPGLDAIIATADLRGRERFEEAKGGPPRLLGEVLPQRLRDEILPGLGIRAENTGIILAGDFYTVPGLDKRGGSGDVTAVWQAFGQYFKWTVGVPGNHDTFGATPHPASSLGRNLFYLDDARVTLDGLAAHSRDADRQTTSCSWGASVGSTADTGCHWTGRSLRRAPRRSSPIRPFVRGGSYLRAAAFRR